MDLSIYFSPLSLKKEQFADNTFGQKIDFYANHQSFPSLSNCKVALIGVEESRAGEKNAGAELGPNEVRQHLYKLFANHYSLKIVDLGNIKQGHELKDTYFAISQVVAELIKANIIPVILGGTNDIAYANYMAYEKLEQTVNLIAIDNGFDLGDVEDEIASKAYLNKIILHQPNFLFNYCNIGYQTYFVDAQQLDLMTKLFFDVHRLGEIRANMQEVEPIIRNADMVSFDMSAIRQSDAPGNAYVTPNGFYGEEACQIMRYAGLSDKVSSIGIYEFNPTLDNNGQTAHLIAQMLWYFFEGCSLRRNDYPDRSNREYLKYRVTLQNSTHEIVFYKSVKTNRWWMDIPFPTDQRLRYHRHHLVPCSYKDYQTACEDEIPDKWWRTYQKLS